MVPSNKGLSKLGREPQNKDSSRRTPIRSRDNPKRSTPHELGDQLDGADSGRSGALIPFEVGQHSAAMWGRTPPGSGALFGL